MRRQSVCAVLLLVASVAPNLAGDREAAAERATDPETGAFPPGWAIGPALFLKSETYVARDRDLLPAPLVYYSGDRCSIFLDHGGCRLVGNDVVELSIIGGLRLEGYKASDSDFLDGMEDRGVSFDVGLGVELDTSVGDFELELLIDALSEHEGEEYSISWAVPIVLERTVLRPSLGYQWKSEDLADYYYGVRSEEATSRRPAYDVGSTNTWTVSLVANHRISENWLFISLAEWQGYSSDIENSPIVEDAGQVIAFAGAAWHF